MSLNIKNTKKITVIFLLLLSTIPFVIRVSHEELLDRKSKKCTYSKLHFLDGIIVLKSSLQDNKNLLYLGLSTYM